VDDGASHAVGGAWSFTAATVVTAEAGKQAIGTLKVGQKVLADTPKTHKIEEEPIVQVWKHTDDDVVDLTLTVQTHAPHSTVTHSKSEVVHTNKKHPFLTVEQGFLPVASVKVGMHVKRADGRVGIVTVWKRVPGITMMYNLEVAQDHTFTVGDGQWIVHNCAKPTLDRFERYGSPEEAQAAQTSGQLSFKSGTKGPDGGTKWISSIGKASWKALGAKTHSWKMVIETASGTRDWLNTVGTFKENEPFFYGIPTEYLDEFNSRIIRIVSSPVR